MPVYKRFNGKRVTSKDPNYAKARWWMHKKIKGHKTIHKALPEALTKEQAQTAERKEIESIFNRKYGIYDAKITFTQFVDKIYLKYVKQHNVDQTGKKIFTDFLKKYFGSKPLVEITAQDCRDCQNKLKNSKTKFDKPYGADSINKYMSTLSKIFTLACEEGNLSSSPMLYVKKLKPPPARKRVLSPEQKEKLSRELDKDLFLKRIVILASNPHTITHHKSLCLNLLLPWGGRGRKFKSCRPDQYLSMFRKIPNFNLVPALVPAA